MKIFAKLSDGYVEDWYVDTLRTDFPVYEMNASPTLFKKNYRSFKAYDGVLELDRDYRWAEPDEWDVTDGYPAKNDVYPKTAKTVILKSEREYYEL